jgi:hypothetical protein
MTHVYTRYKLLGKIVLGRSKSEYSSHLRQSWRKEDDLQGKCDVLIVSLRAKNN